MPDYSEPFSPLDSVAGIGELSPTRKPAGLADLTSPTYLVGDELSGFKVTDVPPTPDDFLTQLTDAKFTYRNLEFKSGLLSKGQLPEFLDKQLISRDPITGQQVHSSDTDLEDLVNVFPSFFGGGVDTLIEKEDPTFSGKTTWGEFEKTQPQLAQYLIASGKDPEMFQSVKNRDAFNYSINRELLLLKVNQDMEIYSKSVSGTVDWLNTAASLGLNYLILDPDTQQLSVAGAAIQAIKGGAKALAATESVQGVGKIERGLANIDKALSLPGKLHAGLVAKTNLKAAMAIEGGVFGLVNDLSMQHQTISFMDSLYGDPKYQPEFSYGELGMSVATGGFLGLVGGVGIERFQDRAKRLKAMENVGVNPDGPIGRLGTTAEAIALQQAADDSRYSINLLAKQITGGENHLFSWAISDDMLEAVGLDIHDLHSFMHSIAANKRAGVAVTNAALYAEVQDFFSQAAALYAKNGQAVTIRDISDLEAYALREQGAAMVANWRANRQLVADPDFQAAVEAGIVKGPRVYTNGEIKEKVLQQVGMAAAGDINPVTLRADGKPFEVDPKRLTLSNTPLNEDQVLAYADNKAYRQAGLIELVREADGSLRVTDGNHRVTAALMEGDPTVKAVIKQDKYSPTIPHRILVRSFTHRDYVPTTTAGKLRQKVAEEAGFIQSMKGELVRAKDPKDKANIEAEILRSKKRMANANARIRDKYPDPPLESFSTIANSYKKGVADLDAAQQDAILERLYQAQTAEDPAQVMQDTNLVSRIFKAAGLDGLIRNLILDKTGLPNTVYSKLRPLRSVTAMFGQPKVLIDSLISRERGGQNFTFAQHDALRLWGKSLKEFEAARNALPRAGREKAWQSAMSEAVMALSEDRIADNPISQQIMKAWKQYTAATKKEGLANKVLRKDQGDNYIPLRLNSGVARNRRLELARLLTQRETQKWADSDNLNQLTMDLMGWISRKEDRQGKVEISLPPTSPFKDKAPKKRGDLTPAQMAEYDKALTELKNERGRTAIEESMHGYIKRQLKEDGVEGDLKSAILTIDRTSSASSAQVRVLDQAVLADPKLREFFVTDLSELGHDYARSTGFRIKAQTAMDQHLGIAGFSISKYLDKMEALTVRDLAVDTTSSAQIKQGFERLRAMYLDMQGQLPHLLSSDDTVTNWLAGAGSRGALMLFGGGIGQSIVTVENIVSVFMRVANPVDFVSNIMSAFRSTISRGIGDPFVKDELAGTILGVRRFTNHHASRFITGAVDSSTDWTPLARFLRPWRDAINTGLGRITPGPGQGGRIGATVYRGMEAIGASSLQLGLSKHFTEAGWAIQMHSLRRETARYLPAARKLRDALTEVDLEALRNQVRLANIKKGDAEASRIANAKVFKEYKSLARKAGFGDRWDIAQRFQSNGLLDEGVFEILDQANALTGAIKSGKGPMIDLTKLEDAVHEMLPSDGEFLEAVIARIHQSHENVVLKRISEPTAFNRATSAQSRTPIGAMLNSMSSFARSFYDNNVLDMAGMPSRVWLGTISGFMFAEAFGAIAKRLLDGESIDTIEAEFSANPAAFLASNMLKSPVAGAYTFIPKTLIDTYQGKNYPLSAQSAGATAQQQLINMSMDVLRIPSELASGQELSINRSAAKTAQKAIPGANTLFADLALTAFDMRDLPMQAVRKRQKNAISDGYFFGTGPEALYLTPLDEAEDHDFLPVRKD